MMKLRARVESWPLLEPIRITGYTFDKFDFLVVELEVDGVIGRGEASGIYYRGDSPAQALVRIEALRPVIEAGLDRATLAELLPPGGARNALDCALWELESRRQGRPVWQLAGLAAAPAPLRTTFTLGAEDPDKLVRTATAAYAQARAIKMKLTGEPIDHARVKAVRAARPDVWIGVDANQGFTRASLEALMPTLLEAEVGLIEQPFRLDSDSDLDGLRSPIPIAADESVQSTAEIPGLVGRVDVINIKLDKCGGLTEALKMVALTRSLGLRPMVGNMVGTSLAMGPAFLVGQLCDFADLDGPLALREDRAPGVAYLDGAIHLPPGPWGAD